MWWQAALLGDVVIVVGGDPSTASPTVISAVLLRMAHPACLEEADVLGEKIFSSLLLAS